MDWNKEGVTNSVVDGKWMRALNDVFHEGFSQAVLRCSLSLIIIAVYHHNVPSSVTFTAWLPCLDPVHVWPDLSVYFSVSCGHAVRLTASTDTRCGYTIYRFYSTVNRCGLHFWFPFSAAHFFDGTATLGQEKTPKIRCLVSGMSSCIRSPLPSGQCNRWKV